MVTGRWTGLPQVVTALRAAILVAQPAVAAPQHAAAISRTCRIVNRHSGKPLAVADGSTADGASIVQHTGGLPWTVSTSGGANQQWQFIPV